mmetsp:Transcript_2415/g.10371  ORF Transcript_2415/g.10371 Transcript_2415/m.10371 type:complete len:259 (+) Transcript_2415:984-1760(+)
MRRTGRAYSRESSNDHGRRRGSRRGSRGSRGPRRARAVAGVTGTGIASSGESRRRRLRRRRRRTRRGRRRRSQRPPPTSLPPRRPPRRRRRGRIARGSEARERRRATPRRGFPRCPGCPSPLAQSFRARFRGRRTRPCAPAGCRPPTTRGTRGPAAGTRSRRTATSSRSRFQKRSSSSAASSLRPSLLFSSQARPPGRSPWRSGRGPPPPMPRRRTEPRGSPLSATRSRVPASRTGRAIRRLVGANPAPAFPVWRPGW